MVEMYALARTECRQSIEAKANLASFPLVEIPKLSESSLRIPKLSDSARRCSVGCVTVTTS